jgi:hypothetical protein
MEELNKALAEAQVQLRTAKRLRADLDATRESLRRQRLRLRGLKAVLDQEGADIARLEGLSLAGLFYTVLGSKEEQLAKEKQEYLAAKLRYDECQEAVSALEREAQDMKAQLRGLGDVEERYQSILARKEAAIREAGDETAARLARLAEEQANLSADRHELREAISAGQVVLAGLDEVVAALRSASNWGTWDILGGGTFATLAKHSRLDDARAAAHRVQQLLRRFQRELADVAAAEADLDIDVGSFATFADYFFDGLIADWVVQSRMSKSLESVMGVQRRVQETNRRLQRRMDEVRRRAGEIDRDRQRLIAEG